MTGRDRRLAYEYDQLLTVVGNRPYLQLEVAGRNANGQPNAYRITYHIHSICGVERVEELGQPQVSNPPCWADAFILEIVLPPAYPSIDAPPVFRFLTHDDEGNPLPHPWHPNIRWFGPMAGRVCLNRADTYTDIAWGVVRVASYLRYELYHALNEPPYPEDLQVAAWVVRQGEPNGWI